MTSVAKPGRKLGLARTDITMILGGAAVLVVVAIIFGATKAKDAAKITETETLLKTVRTAIEQYKLEIGRSPSEIADLLQTHEAVASSPFLSLPDIPKDAWGQSLILSNAPKGELVISTGPDGKIGTQDDLTK